MRAYLQFDKNPCRTQRAIDCFQRVAFITSAVHLPQLRKDRSDVVDNLFYRKRTLFFSCDLKKVEKLRIS